VHFVLQRVYITVILFPVLQLCAVTVFISEGISIFISLAVTNMKTRLTHLELETIFKNITTLVIFLHTHSRPVLRHCLTLILKANH